jgi:hypothetical protein
VPDENGRTLRLHFHVLHILRHLEHGHRAGTVVVSAVVDAVETRLRIDLANGIHVHLPAVGVHLAGRFQLIHVVRHQVAILRDVVGANRILVERNGEPNVIVVRANGDVLILEFRIAARNNRDDVACPFRRCINELQRRGEFATNRAEREPFNGLALEQFRCGFARHAEGRLRRLRGRELLLEQCERIDRRAWRATTSASAATTAAATNRRLHRAAGNGGLVQSRALRRGESVEINGDDCDGTGKSGSAQVLHHRVRRQVHRHAPAAPTAKELAPPVRPRQQHYHLSIRLRRRDLRRRVTRNATKHDIHIADRTRRTRDTSRAREPLLVPLERIAVNGEMRVVRELARVVRQHLEVRPVVASRQQSQVS